MGITPVRLLWPLTPAWDRSLGILSTFGLPVDHTWRVYDDIIIPSQLMMKTLREGLEKGTALQKAGLTYV